MINTQSMTEQAALLWTKWRSGTAPSCKLIAREMNALNRLFDRHGIAAYVTPKKAWHSRKANFVRYEILTDEKHNKVTGLEQEIRAELFKARDGFAKVRFTGPLLCIETDHPAGTIPLRWEDAPLAKLRSKEAIIGQDYSYRKARPATIHFADDTIAHVMGAARSGGGKTMLLRNMVLSLAYSTSPKFASFVILDPKNDPKLRQLDSLPHLPHGVTRGMEACLTMLDRLIAEKDQRTQSDPINDLFVFVDEFVAFTDGDKEAQSKFSNLANIGRGLGIHLVMYTQNPLADKMGSDTKANVSVTIGGAVRTIDNARAIFGPGVNSGAEKLPGKGSFLVMREDGDLGRIQTFLLEDAQVPLEVSLIADKWGASTANPVADIVAVGPALPKGVSQQEINQVQFTYSLDELVDEDGQWRDGMKSQVARCRSVDKGAGSNYAWAEKVRKWLLET